MRRLLCAALVAAACSPGLSYPTSGVRYTCSDTNRCPLNETCNPQTHLCESPSSRAYVLGQNCKNGDDCASGNCTDGVCCDTACSGTCERCDQQAKLGTCSPTPSGLDPDHECEKAGQHQNCASRCDGNRHCTPIPDGLQCGDCLACNFQGACLDCGAFACQNKACLRNCRGPGDCASGSVCTSGGVCVGAKANGVACQAGGECASSNCVGGICCHDSCDQQPQSTCQHGGLCRADGSSCALYPSSAVCAPPVCSNGILTPQRACDGSGTCAAATAANCLGDYACADSTSCTRNRYRRPRK